MFILTLFFSKGSVLFLLKALALAKGDRLMVYILAGMMALWVFTSLFVSAFQCPLPQAWEILNGKCLNQVCIPCELE
jgi:hypothetical protein